MAKLTRLQWAEAERDYIENDTPQRVLCERYHISVKSLSAYAARHAWETKRREYHEGKIILAPLKPEIELPQAHLGLTDEEAREQIYRAADIAAERIREALTKDTLGAQAIKALTSALRDIKEIRDCRDGLTEQEMHARIAKLRRDAEVGTGGDAVINITVQGADTLSD